MGNLNQRVDSRDHHLPAVIPPPPLGEVDAWEYSTLDYSHRVACSSIRSFLYYLYSPGTMAVGAPLRGHLNNLGWVAFRLRGPRADNGHRLWLAYVAFDYEARIALTEAEREAFAEKLRKDLHLPHPPIKILGLSR